MSTNNAPSPEEEPSLITALGDETRKKGSSNDSDDDDITSSKNSNARLVNKGMISSHEAGSNVTDDTDRSIHGPQYKKKKSMEYVKAFMRDSTHFSEVTMEQIDRIRMMHDRFEEGSLFSFNYNVLLLVASVLAGLGLVSNNNTTVIASMLVSPIMGPVVGIAYGATIHDFRLCRKAIQTELVSLLVCIVVGAFLGMTCGHTQLAQEWPTMEMKSRAHFQNLYVALPVAFFSGLGVAVSLLDEQTSSLVGVAISASLLPPAVNAGILWVCYGFYEHNENQDEEYFKNDYGYSQYYTDDDNSANAQFASGYERQDFRQGGMVSLLLTIANVVLIIIASMLMFRLKEVSG